MAWPASGVRKAPTLLSRISSTWCQTWQPLRLTNIGWVARRLLCNTGAFLRILAKGGDEVKDFWGYFFLAIYSFSVSDVAKPG